MTTAQVVETSVAVTNSSFKNYTHPDDHTRQTTKRLRVQVNVFANKLKVGQHRGHNQFFDVAFYGPHHQINSKNRIYIQ